MDTIIAMILGMSLADWIFVATSILTAATAFTAVTPSKVDGKYLDAALKFLNILAGNVGRNKNYDAVITKTEKEDSL